MNKVTIKRFTKSSIQISCDCFSVFVFDTSQLAAGLFIYAGLRLALALASSPAVYVHLLIPTKFRS